MRCDLRDTALVPRHRGIEQLSRQCLCRRIPSIRQLTREVATWERNRDATGARINWMFTVEDARRTLGNSYPAATKPGMASAAPADGAPHNFAAFVQAPGTPLATPGIGGASQAQAARRARHRRRPRPPVQPHRLQRRVPLEGSRNTVAARQGAYCLWVATSWRPASTLARLRSPTRRSTPKPLAPTPAPNATCAESRPSTRVIH